MADHGAIAILTIDFTDHAGLVGTAAKNIHDGTATQTAASDAFAGLGLDALAGEGLLIGPEAVPRYPISVTTGVQVP